MIIWAIFGVHFDLFAEIRYFNIKSVIFKAVAL